MPTTSLMKQKWKYTRKPKAPHGTTANATATPPPTPLTRTLGRRKANGRRHTRGRDPHRPHTALAGNDLSDDSTCQLHPVNPTILSAPELRMHNSEQHRVRVLLRDLEWDGEMLPIPCPTVLGIVSGVRQGEDGRDLLEVDLGHDFGKQTLPRSVCQTEASAEITPSEHEGITLPDHADQIGSDHACAEVPCSSFVPLNWELPDSDSDHDWDLALLDLGNGAEGCSTGGSSDDMQEDDPLALMGELGLYPLGPEPRTVDLDLKYCDDN